MAKGGTKGRGLTAPAADEVPAPKLLDQVRVLLLAIRAHEPNIQVRPKRFLLRGLVRIRPERKRHLRGRHRLHSTKLNVAERTREDEARKRNFHFFTPSNSPLSALRPHRSVASSPSSTMAPVASTSKLYKGKTKESSTPSLLSNSRALPAQSDYVPPTQSLKKYLYSSAGLANQNFLKNKSFPDKKLAHHLTAIQSSAKASAVKSYEHDDLLLNKSNRGLIETETALERTWKVTQKEIVDSSAIGVESKAFSLKLDQFGPYDIDYTRNGRSVSSFPRCV